MMALRRPLPLWAYRAGLALAEPLVELVLAVRCRNGKEDKTRLDERRGYPAYQRPLGRLAWLHGASVGETVSLLPVVERLIARGFRVLVTSGTVTSATILARRLPAGAFHQYVPLDVPRYARRFMEAWRPDLALIAESELWPNLIFEAAHLRVPLILVNGRMSERSYRRWQRTPAVSKALLSCFDLCLAQTAQDARRIAHLGAPHVGVAGNLKFDVPAPPADPAVLAALSGLVGGRPVWVAASTHPGEEAMAATVHASLKRYFPDLLTVIAPRHPQRGESIAALVASKGLNAVRRSQGAKPAKSTDVYIVDTIGELGLFYRLAPVAFMGGSLVPHGGQNPIEPAKLGTAILHGPHIHNFADVYAALNTAGGALSVTDLESFKTTLGSVLHDPGRVRLVARAAADVVGELGGAVARTMHAIEPYLLSMMLDTQDRPIARSS